jgi:hypothetical protein
LSEWMACSKCGASSAARVSRPSSA